MRGERVIIEKCYIRFGDLPVNTSRNYLTGEMEAGISVYEAIIDGDQVKLVFPDLTYSACVSLSGVLERQAFIVEGEQIGIGSDGEPLLRDCKIKQLLMTDSSGKLKLSYPKPPATYETYEPVKEE